MKTKNLLQSLTLNFTNEIEITLNSYHFKFIAGLQSVRSTRVVDDCQLNSDVPYMADKVISVQRSNLKNQDS